MDKSGCENTLSSDKIKSEFCLDDNAVSGNPEGALREKRLLRNKPGNLKNRISDHNILEEILEEDDMENKKIKLFCEHCDYSARDNWNLERHKSEVHIECVKCKILFSVKENLLRIFDFCFDDYTAIYFQIIIFLFIILIIFLSLIMAHTEIHALLLSSNQFRMAVS